MDVIRTTNKDKMLDTMGKFYIYKEARINNQINDKCAVKPNIVFDTLILKNTARAQTTPQQPIPPTYLNHRYYSHANTRMEPLCEQNHKDTHSHN
jgi:hypothetical protein